MVKEDLILDQPASAINSLRAWVVVFACATFCFYQFVLMNMFNSLNESIMKEFHLTAVGLGYLSSMYFYSNMFSLIPAGILIDRFSTRKIILVAMSVSLFSTFLFGIATNPIVAMMARLFNGIGGAFCFLSMIRIATQWFDSKKLGLVIGLAVSFIVSGGIVAQTPMALMIDYVGWRYALEIFGAGGVLMLLFIYLIVQDSPQYKFNPSAEKEMFKFSYLLHTFLSALKNSQTWLGGFYICLMNIPIFLLGALWGTLYLTQGIGLERSDSTYIISIMYIGMILGSPSIGWFSDKIGSRKIPMISFAALASIVLWLMINLTTFSMLKLIVLFFALGFFLSAQVLGYPFIAESTSPKLVGTAESIGNTILFAGGLTQALFAKVLESQWDHTMSGGVPLYSLSNFNRSLYIIFFAFVMATVVGIVIKETHCKMQLNGK